MIKFLEIIGIILLIILALILVVVLLVLFCPIEYKLNGTFDNKEQKLKGRVSWLFGALSIVFRTYDEISVYAKILFFKKMLYSGSDEPEEDDNIELIDEKNELPHEEESIHEKNIHEDIKNIKDNENTDNNNVNNEELSEEISENKILDFYNKKIDKLKSTKSKITDLLSKISDTSGKIKDTIDDKNNKEAISHLKKELLYLLSMIMPKKLKLKLKFSTGSPDSTGLVLGILAMFPIGYTNRWNIEPDFEADEFYLIGNTDVKGYFFGYQLIGIILRIIFDKNCRKLYNNFNK